MSNETTPSEPSVDATVKRRRSLVGCSFVLLRVMATVLIGGVVALAILATIRHQHLHQRLSQRVKTIRYEREPLDGTELATAYAIPPDVNDLTTRYQQALAPIGEAEKGLFDLFREDDTLADESWSIALNRETVWPSQERYEELVATFRMSLDQLYDLTDQAGEVRYPTTFDRLVMTAPYSKKTRLAALLLVSDFTLHCRAQRQQESLRSLLALHQLAESLAHHPSESSQLLRLSIHERTASCLEQLLSKPDLDHKELERLTQIFSRPDFRDGARKTLLASRALGYQWFSTQGQLPESPEMSLPSTKASRPLSSARPGDVALFLDAYSTVIDGLENEFPGPLHSSEIVHQWQMDARQPLIRIPSESPALASLAIPSVSVKAAAIGTARQRCALVVLALERHRRTAGSLPESLDAVMHELPEASSIDPFTGGRLEYLLETDRYTVYSLGDNRRDDGGIDIDNALMADIGLRVGRAE